MAGDEESAHKHFTLATRADPRNELAWRWRSRTSATVEDVISCLEQMLAAIPSNEEAKTDLDLARVRRDRETELAAARAAARAAETTYIGPTLLQRVLAVSRRLALELASVPSFILGLLWLGHPVLDAFASIGVHGLEPLMPVFNFPRIMVNLPASLVEPTLPATFGLADVAPIVLAIWYLLLAFRVADGSNGARYAAIVSGLVSLAATTYVVGNGRVFLVAAAVLLVLSLVGKGGSREAPAGLPVPVSRIA